MAFGRGKSNHTLARCVFFLPTLFSKNHRNTINVAMKVIINTIGKKIHTLVTENTPDSHKIRQKCVSFKRLHFSAYCCVFFPVHCCVNIGRQVRLIPPNTYQEIYDTHTCLNFLKTCQDVCLYKTY